MYLLEQSQKSEHQTNMCPFVGDTNYHSPHVTKNTSPWTPEASQWRGIPWAEATKNGPSDTCKGFPSGATGSLEHGKGRVPRWHLPVFIPRGYSSRSLNVCVKLAACPLGRGFNISRWISFTISLGMISCLWARPWGEWVQVHEPISDWAHTILWVSGHKPCWFSKLDVLGAYLLSVLKVGVPNVGFESFVPPGQSSRFWVPSGLWVIAFGLRVRVSLCLAFPTHLDVVFFLFPNVWWSVSHPLWFLKRKLFYMWL